LSDLSTDPHFDPERTAVVVIDMVNHQCTPGQGMLGAWEASGTADPRYIIDRLHNVVLPAHAVLLPALRRTGGKVVFLRVGAYDASYDDLTPGFKRIASWEPRADLWGTEVLSGLDYRSGDVTLIKTGSGGFYTSALDSHLRNMRIDTVIYTGVITNGCVMLTAAGGFDRGYRGIVASDGTATLSAPLQATAEVMMDGFIANVSKTKDIVEMLEGHSSVPLAPRNPVAVWAEQFSTPDQRIPLGQ
jgi:nicotinamidase-related amidase